MASIPFYFALPLIAGLLYAFGALLLKRALSHDAGIMRSVFCANLFMAVAFFPLIFMGEGPESWTRYGYALVLGLTFFLGQLFTFVAMRVGDVSIATPVLGSKVLFVAIAGWLIFGETIPWIWWAGAVLTTVAILLLGASDLKNARVHFAGICFAVISAAFFGLTDALLPVFAAKTGQLTLIGVMFFTVGVLSFGLIPFFKEPLSRIGRSAWPWLLGGSVVLGVQTLIMAMTLAFFGNPTVVNILYSGRGLWTFVLIGLVGGWLQSSERRYDRRTMRFRYAGAVMLTLAVILVMLFPGG